MNEYKGILAEIACGELIAFETEAIPLARWKVVRACDPILAPWWAFLAGPGDLDRGFPTWREAFDYADRMAHQ
ncbi:hypothetical protein [Gordonia sp. 852002-10350_SCH5691597]|uniref:hypothetical protein n=1 Tax=Gordonia sp. 852002-10350_SCH5691597 TaxID=1834085 RepID=UPI0007E9FB27|nr:hypothetical protein [Gordonia sp. 852002-10350_SCH5691597]OBA56888.1 hypothetical protein A5777_07745 [Gordonia sp. 852002-10350_SCH5691597]